MTSTPPFDPDRFDSHDPAFHADPYPTYALFRKHAPVHWIEARKSYWVFSHALVTEVCESCNYLKKPRDYPDPRGIFHMDPPRHTEIRSMLNPLFAQAIASAPARAAELADEALSDIRLGGGEMELVAAFAKRVPRDVFMHVFGVPADRRFAFDGWADTLLALRDQRPGAPEPEALSAAKAALGACLRDLRSRCPSGAPDALMCLMKAKAEPQSMKVDEVILTGFHFALGGYLSTQFLLATGVYNLLRDGGQAMKALRANPGLMPNAIAEMLRYDAPFQMAERFAKQQTTLGGITIPEGAMVVVVYGSANRDDSVFSDAQTFDIHRTPNPRSYGFGHGEHHCIGEPLVDIVAPIALRKLLTEFPDLSLGDEEPTWLSDPYFRSFNRLAMRL